MAQALRRRSSRDTPGSNLLGLIVVLVLVFGGFVYVFRVLTTGDLLWFSSAFNEQPRQLAVIDQGQRIDIPPSDPFFHELTEALNASISGGYHYSGFGISDGTWERIEQQGVMIEATYAGPVKLRGGVQPTERLLLLLGGDDLWTEQILFRSDSDEWDRIPLRISTVDPVREALARKGITLQ